MIGYDGISRIAPSEGGLKERYRSRNLLCELLPFVGADVPQRLVDIEEGDLALVVRGDQLLS